VDLFDHALSRRLTSEAPLAARMRPRTLDEYIGQEYIVGPGRLLRRAIEADRLFSSILLWGPPGTGKTTLAMVIANSTRSHFETISAVLAGVADLRRVISEAKERRKLHGTRTTLFVDEVHRWNKAQQDALLPHVEDGTITLIGATTENPYFEVIGALVSRSRIFQLRPLTDEDVQTVIERAVKDEMRGFGKRKIEIDAEAMAHYGDADAFFLALRQANPIGIGSVVASARPRQANCYYTSSDAALADRYEALARYDQVKTGAVALEGGWRVYSSGAGIAVRLIHECFLGIRKSKSALVVDPVIPKALDGLRAEIELAGKRVDVVYHIAAAGHGPTALTLNGTALPFERTANPYRCGAAQIAMAAVTALLNDQANTLSVQLR